MIFWHYDNRGFVYIDCSFGDTSLVNIEEVVEVVDIQVVNVEDIRLSLV